MSEDSSVAPRRTRWEEITRIVQDAIDVPAVYQRYEQLSPRHIPIFQLKVNGFTNTEIGAALNFTAKTVAEILRSTAGQKLLQELYTELGITLSGDIEEQLKSAGQEAVETTVDVMRTGRDDHRLKAALSILDRVGASGVRKTETTKRVIIEKGQADLLRLALEESSEIVDADFELIEEEVKDE